LNIGPTADGSIPPESVQSFTAIGTWMKKNSKAIYATTANPLGAVAWGRITAKPDRLYLHVFDWPADGKLLVPATLTRGAARASFLAELGKRKLPGTPVAGGYEITLPAAAPDKIATVIELRGKFSARP
jgi:alpha-L-fucosidase